MPTDPPPLIGHGSPRVQRPDGSMVLFLSDDVRLVEARDGSYTVEADDLATPLPIDRAEVVRAAAQVANLIAARLHDARRAAQVLDDAIHGTDTEAWAATIANEALDGRGEQ